MADLITMLSAVAGQQGGEEVDDDFNQTVLLLHGDGTNGAQNNTFLDSSTNNFTITRNGNTTQGTFSPFSVGAGEWSNYFGGGSTTERRLTTTQTAIGTGNFTVAFWLYLAGTTGNDQQFFDTGASGFTIAVNSSTQLYLFNRSADSAIISASSATAISLNTWVHVAVVRSGTGASQVTMYVNGSSVGTGTASTNFTSTTISIGGRFAVDGSTWYTTFGYISNVLYADSALSITVPTTPYTNQSGTKLLTCQSNRFVDNSSGALTITRNGDVRVTPFSPFAPTAAYSAGTNGGSGYFDGTTDYLQISNQTALQVGGGAFTAEAWIYPTTFGGAYRAIFGKRSGPTSEWQLSLNNTNNEVLAYITSTTISTGLSALKDQWNHVAMSHDGTNLSIYVNGVRGSNTVTTISNSTAPLRIGAIEPQSGQPIEEYTGYISGFRVVKGTALYSGTTLTIPTAPPTAITNTSLLCNFTNAGIIDNTGKNVLETVGNAQIDTAVKKFGTGSLEFAPGQTNPLVIPHSELFSLNSGDFTIEAWVYLNSDRTFNFIISKGGATTREWGVNVGPTNIRFYWSTNGLSTGDSTVSGSASLPLSTWMHIAVTRSGNSIRLFKDGTQVGSTGTFTSMYSGTGPVYVGRLMDFNNISHDLDGFIDDLRITKGVARYTANFTAPTKAFPDQ